MKNLADHILAGLELFFGVDTHVRVEKLRKLKTVDEPLSSSERYKYAFYLALVVILLIYGILGAFEVVPLFRSPLIEGTN